MIFWKFIPVFYLFVHVSALPSSPDLSKRSRPYSAYSVPCDISTPMPSGAWHWQRYNTPIISGHTSSMNTEDPFVGKIDHKTQVEQNSVIGGKGPPRHWQALFRGEYSQIAPNSFELSEWYDSDQVTHHTPDLSETFYIVTFTDSGGHGNNRQYVIHMPNKGPNDPKMCHMIIDGMTDDKRTFTINRYAHPVHWN